MKNDALIERLNRLIEETGINATAASERAGLAKDYIRNIQRGKAQSPTVEKLKNLAEKGFGADFIWLSTGNGRPFPDNDRPFQEPFIFGALPGSNYKENLAFWLRDAVERAGLTEGALLQRLTRQVGRPLDKATLKKMFEGNKRIAADELLAVEKITQCSAPRDLRVPLIGAVAEGGELRTYGDDGLRMVVAPPDTTPLTVAYEVNGDFMLPAYEPRTIIYFSEREPPANLADSRRCIVRLKDRRLFIRKLRHGSKPSVWTLQSLSPYEPDMKDIEIAAAFPITWVKPPDTYQTS